MNLAGLFDYFQHGQVFLLARDGVSTQEFFLFTQELMHFTHEILPLLPKKLRAPYSRNLRVPINGVRISDAQAMIGSV